MKKVDSRKERPPFFSIANQKVRDGKGVTYEGHHLSHILSSPVQEGIKSEGTPPEKACINFETCFGQVSKL